MEYVRDEIVGKKTARQLLDAIEGRRYFSNALLEYMAVGLTTVATQVGGNRECPASSERSLGSAVPPDHPNALGDVIFAICWRILASRHSWRLPDESGCAPALVSDS